MAEQLVIKINGDVKNYQDSLKEIQGQTRNLQDGLTSIAKKSALAFAALTGAVIGSVAAYRTQEQAEIRTRQTIKATGGAAGLTAEEIFKMAGALQNMTTFGDEAIISGQNMLLTFKNIGKDVFPRTTEVMLDMAEAMGTDLKSTAIQLGKALNDPKVGLTALQRVGITFNEQQKKQIKTMQESGDIASAQAIILKELESQFGGVAKAAAEGTGQLIQLKNIVGDLVEDFGKKFLPVILEITKPLKDFFLAFRENDALIESIVTVTKWGLAITGTIAAATTAGALVIGLSTAIGALTIAFAPATLAASSFWVAITGPIGIAVAGIGLVTAGVIALWDAMNNTEPAERLKEINQLLDEKNKSLEFNLKIAKELNKPSDGLAITQIRESIAALNEEKLAIEENLRIKMEANQLDFQSEFELNQKKLEERRKENENIKIERQKAFDEKRDFLITGEQILTEEELELLQERIDLKLEQDLIAKAQELENQGQHNEALDLLEDARTKKTIDNSKKANSREKRDRDKRQRDEKSAADQRKRLDAQVNKSLSDGAFTLANEIVKASGSSAKKIFIIQKLLGLAQIAVNTQMAMALAVATIPPPAGEVVAASRLTAGLIQAGVVAGVAGIQLQGMAKGGVLQGGIPGVDSIPILAQRKEVIAPSENFEELIGSVRAKREAEKLGDSGVGGSGNLSLMVSYDSEEASQIVTVRQTEDSALGISQQSFNEAV